MSTSTFMARDFKSAYILNLVKLTFAKSRAKHKILEKRLNSCGLKKINFRNKFYFWSTKMNIRSSELSAESGLGKAAQFFDIWAGQNVV